MKMRNAFASIVMVVALLFTLSVFPMVSFAADGSDTVKPIADETVGTVTDDEAANQGIDRSDLARDDVQTVDGPEIATDGTQNITQISADVTDDTATKTDNGFNWWWLLLLPLAALLAWFFLRPSDDDKKKAVKKDRDGSKRH